MKRIVTGSIRRTGNSSNLVHILHHVLSGRFEIGEEGDSVGNGLEIVDRQLDTDGMSDGDQMQDGVGRSTQNHRQNLQSKNEISCATLTKGEENAP